MLADLPLTTAECTLCSIDAQSSSMGAIGGCEESVTSPVFLFTRLPLDASRRVSRATATFIHVALARIRAPAVRHWRAVDVVLYADVCVDEFARLRVWVCTRAAEKSGSQEEARRCRRRRLWKDLSAHRVLEEPLSRGMMKILYSRCFFLVTDSPPRSVPVPLPVDRRTSQPSLRTMSQT
jgi:hypothetical protein